MKKLLSLLLALCLLCACTAALAQDIDRMSFEPVSYDSVLYALGDTGCSFAAPADWTPQELTEDELAWGVVARLTTPDGALLEVSVEESTEPVALAELATMMEGWKGYTNIYPAYVNDEPYVFGEQDEDDMHWFFMMRYLPQEDETQPPLFVWFRFACEKELQTEEFDALCRSVGCSVLPDAEASD